MLPFSEDVLLSALEPKGYLLGEGAKGSMLRGGAW